MHLYLFLKEDLIGKTEIDVETVKSLFDNLEFDFGIKNLLLLYVFLLNAYIDKGGDEKNIIEYLFKIQEYNVKNHNILVKNLYLSYENEEELKELKNKITPDINIAFIEKIIEKYSNDNNIFWLDDYFLNIDKQSLCFLLNKTDDSTIRKDINKTYNLFSYCLRMSKEKFPDNYQKIIQPYLNTEQKKNIFNKFVNPKQIEYPWQKKYKELKEKEKREHEKILLEHIEEIKNADKKYEYILINLSLKNGMKKSSISYIEKKYGKEISEAYKQGIQKYWQVCDVNFDEYLNKVIGTNKILYQTIAALTGLHIYFEENKNKNIVLDLDEDKAKRIIYWGIQELNSIPEWAVKTIEKYPQIAKDVIIPITNKIVEENNEIYFFEKFSRTDSKVLSIFYDDFWNIITKKSQYIGINNILNIVVGMDLSQEQKNVLIKYINTKIDGANIEEENTIKLFELLYEVDLDSFINKISELDKKYCKEQEKLKNFFEKLFGNLEYPIKYKKKNKIDDNRKMIKLIPLLFEYIDPNNDTKHENMIVFSENKRDLAQDFRNTIFDYINVKNFKINDRDYLLDLLPKIKIYYVKDCIKYVADQLLMKNEKVSSEQNVINIEKMDYLPPKNSNDLFRIVCGKLDEIKTDIETADYSLKEFYINLFKNNKSGKEKVFQKSILMELRILSKNLYSAVREPEGTNNKKPDFQIWDKNWCVNIECKIADNGSIKKLFNAIDSQLIDKYLKYPKYQHGILLLAKIQNLKSKKISFDELIVKIQNHADKVKKKYSHIKDIKVIGIDYSK